MADRLRADLEIDIDVKDLLERNSIRSIAVCLETHAGSSSGGESTDGAELDLFDLAYTLQVGREAMEERLGFVAHSLDEVANQLQDFLDRDLSAGLYRGQLKSTREALTSSAADAEMAGTIDICLRNGEYEKLLDLWVKGQGVDWTRLYGADQPRRISLPTYPFARERYWISGAAPQPTDRVFDPNGGRPEPDRDMRRARMSPANVVSPNLLPNSLSAPFSLCPSGGRQPRHTWTRCGSLGSPPRSDRVVIVGAVEACREELAQAVPDVYFLDLRPGDSEDEITRKMAVVAHIDHIVWMAPHEPLPSLVEDRMIDDQERGVLLMLRAVKALLALGYGSRHLGLDRHHRQYPIHPPARCREPHPCRPLWAGRVHGEGICQLERPGPRCRESRPTSIGSSFSPCPPTLGATPGSVGRISGTSSNSCPSTTCPMTRPPRGSTAWVACMS